MQGFKGYIKKNIIEVLKKEIKKFKNKKKKF